MAKLLRMGETISFVQTRVPDEMWRYIKSKGAEVSPDATITQFTTENLADYLSARPWITSDGTGDHEWLRPRDLKGKSGLTGFKQRNLPLSNMEPGSGGLMCARAWLRRNRLEHLVQGVELQQALDTGESSELFKKIAEGLAISAATLGYNFIYWLAIIKHPPVHAGKGGRTQREAAEEALGVRFRGTPFRRKAS